MSISQQPLVSAIEDDRTPAVYSLKDALQVLQNQPDIASLRHVLQYLNSEADHASIDLPNPEAAKIVNTLVSVILPDFWGTIRSSQSDASERRLLTACLTSIPGIGSILARLKLLAAELQEKKGNAQNLAELLEILDVLLQRDDFVQKIWTDINSLEAHAVRRTILWKDFVSQVASGRIVSTAAQAENALRAAGDAGPELWLADGSKYARWLGRNVAAMAKTIAEKDDRAATAAAQLLEKSFSLGYTPLIIEEIHVNLLFTRPSLLRDLRNVIEKLRTSDQQRFLQATLSMLDSKFLQTDRGDEDESPTQPSKAIGGSAALLRDFASDNGRLQDALVEWLTDDRSGGSTKLRRAALAALQTDEDRMQRVMERNMQQFGDPLFIKHTPIVQQEAIAQTLLMACGYVHRALPMFVFTLARSSVHMNGVSNRLASSSPRTRWLGMVVGMSVSALVDKPGNQMKFDLEELETVEARWYQDLVHVNDQIGSIDDLVLDVKRTEVASISAPEQALQSSSRKSIGKGALKKQTASVPRHSHAKSSHNDAIPAGLRIVELSDDSEEDDLVPYAKPDSDPEDDDPDPTLVQRNRPTAPVYIRDLIAGLKDTENYDRHSLALSTASSLIRRKANFGTEVTDHIEELATTLVGLNDTFELDGFQEMRQEAMIAVLLAQPAKMGPWFARTFFEGDYSMAQRVSILTTLGLSARELAGFKGEDVRPSNTKAEPSFPSKRLPEKLHKIYASESITVDAQAKRLAHTMIEPMALTAADKLSGPNALKVRTFSSRMEVEKRRTKAIPNELAKLVAQHFFFPLTGRCGNDNLYFSPILLPAFLKTLALLLHASGPSTLSLPQMTSEFWDLLLSVRSNALNDPAILEAVLFALLTLLDVNEDQRRLAQEHAKELIETQEWVKLVFERVSGGDEESERVRMLAAGVLVRCGEIVEKFQRLLMGDLVGF
ncbi:telomere binding protein [Coniosporium apollinis]|uniref:Telomere binding protein n=1 Tax=Coniosporium apollinis TaxID=61459 RepID=A0ABQ9P3F0_9PEZI|nr:telomere binding protein [Coniosporium apollinis]